MLLLFIAEILSQWIEIHRLISTQLRCGNVGEDRVQSAGGLGACLTTYLLQTSKAYIRFILFKRSRTWDIVISATVIHVNKILCSCKERTVLTVVEEKK